MSRTYYSQVAKELQITERQVAAAAGLFDEGATIPFIARYRKEMTGSLDEVVLSSIRDRLQQLADLDSRREAILKSLSERDLLDDELRNAVNTADTLAKLEDVYLPYRPKRRTRATIAREKGLEPLAKILFDQGNVNPVREATSYVNPEKGVANPDEALAGARDIIAEWINEHAEIRSALRTLFMEKGALRSKLVTGKEQEGAKFRDYFDASERVSSAPGHRVLAMFRGEKEGMLSVSVQPERQDALAIIERKVIKARNDAGRQTLLAAHDGYDRLLAPSLETEARKELKQRADEEAIAVFAANLRDLLYAPPLGRRRILALDPGFRTGAKLVCLDEQGKLLRHETIYPLLSEKERENAGERIRELCRTYKIQAITIGNGTGGRETETFVRSLGLSSDITIVMTDESGASIYSASKVAREEFPTHDVTVRGAISIGRRLMDPLAELVKIDPKSIGVGQYQHDVDQPALKRGLDDVVMSCVNNVGVELNSASKELLTYVSGLGPALAKNVVARREEQGPFKSRKELLKVPRLGPKAFQQAAGFLRIQDGADPLDSSAVHPESYHIVQKMAADLQTDVRSLIKSEELRRKITLKNYITDTVGLPTLTDIVAELAKPGRDPRDRFEAFSFQENVNSMEDLVVGMTLPGIVTNLTKFGAFVDIGVHQDGLVHISQIADKFIKDPSEALKVRQKVMVKVLEVDISRKRISLTMRTDRDAAPPRGSGRRTG